MKIAVQKNHLEGQILYRNLVPIKKRQRQLDYNSQNSKSKNKYNHWLVFTSLKIYNDILYGKFLHYCTALQIIMTPFVLFLSTIYLFYIIFGKNASLIAKKTLLENNELDHFFE